MSRRVIVALLVVLALVAGPRAQAARDLAGGQYAGSIDESPPAAWSEAIWANVNDVTQIHILACIDQKTTNAQRADLFVRGDIAGDPLQFYIFATPGGGGGPNATPSVGTVIAGEWFHAACVYASASSFSVYLNGTKASDTTDLGAGPIAPDGLTIGGYRGAVTSYDPGEKLAHYAMWNIALTDAEVSSLAAGAHPLSIERDHLIHYLPLDGDSTNEPDYIGTTAFTVVGATKTTRPPLIRGGGRR